MTKRETESQQMDRLIHQTEDVFNRLIGREYNEELAWQWAIGLMITSRLEILASETHVAGDFVNAIHHTLGGMSEVMSVTTLANVKAAMEMGEKTK